jgi:hypothetical protein
MVLLEDLINGDIFMQDLLSGCRRLKHQVILLIYSLFLQDISSVTVQYYNLVLNLQNNKQVI